VLRQDLFVAFLAVFLTPPVVFLAVDFTAEADLPAVFFAPDVDLLAVFLAPPLVFFAVDLAAEEDPPAVFFAAELDRPVVFFAAELDLLAVFFAPEVDLLAVFLAPPLAFLAVDFAVDVVLPAVFFAGDVAFAVVFFVVELAADAVLEGFGNGDSFLAPEITFFRSWPAVNFGTEVFLALIRSPVWGLRTQRALRTRFSKEPNPVMATFSPLATSRVMVSRTDSSACCADFRFPS
jgi:hypothetical protein